MLSAISVLRALRAAAAAAAAAARRGAGRTIAALRPSARVDATCPLRGMMRRRSSISACADPRRP